MSSRPISFSCEATIPLTPEEIASQILDLTKWPEFHGYGPLPGIAQAEFEKRPLEIIGARIQVTNRDGSTHVEEIIEWNPARRLKLRLQDFSAPLSRLATSFEETWEFEQSRHGTQVIRSFVMFPKAILTRPILWMISFLLKRAIARHLVQMSRTDP